MAGGPGGPGRTAGLRIALVCPYSLSRPGGVQGQVLGLARALTGRGHGVTVYAPTDGGVSPPDGVELVVTGHSTALPANGSVAPVSVSPWAARRALGDLRSRRCDVVHVHEPFAPGMAYALLTARGLPPTVATFHRSGGSPLYTLLRPVVRRMADHLAARVAVSEAAEATARHALGGSYEVLYNGIETDRFTGAEPWPATGPVVLFLGRHEERKGLGHLLDAWDLLGTGPSGAAASGSGVPAAPDWAGPTGTTSSGARGSADAGERGSADTPPVLWVAGDGPETGALRHRHPESGRLRWLGIVDEQEKVRRLTAATAVAAPSVGGESFGLVLLEGMAARAVVVASDIDGYRDAAGGRAVLVPPGDVAALAAALRGVLDGSLARGSGADGDGKPTRSAWLESGVERAGEWSMAGLAARYEEIYRSVVVR